MNVGCILAGGHGSRFGGSVPKQYVEVLGKPVLAWTLEVFQRCPEIDALQIVCQEAYADHVREIARRYGVDKLRWITPAGESCPESIRSGILGLRTYLRNDDSVAVHMGVSPLVTPRDIAGALAVCQARGCCFTMHPVTICMARGGGEGWAGVDAPKERYVELNTPWAFRFGEVYGLYRRLDARGYHLREGDYTLGLWLAEGRRAWYAPGSAQSRLKITTTHDLRLFEGFQLLRQRKGVRGEENENG